MQKTKVAIVGLGTVGSGVAKLLLDHGDRTARHAGRTLWLQKAVVRDLRKPRQCDLPPGILTDRLEDVLEDEDIEVVALLMGGLEPARTVMLKLLDAGKDVVTATRRYWLSMARNYSIAHGCWDAASLSKRPLRAAFRSSATSANVSQPIRSLRCKAF